MVDGTKDVTGKEQKAICIWLADVTLNVYEEFMGLCELTPTLIAENLCLM